MNHDNTKPALSASQHDLILNVVRARFEKHMRRHPDLAWADVQARLEAQPDKVWSLHEMERSEGEPDVMRYDAETGAYIFCDFAEESPKGRRSFCYDPDALASRKENKPANSAVGMAADMGIEILTEAQYRHLQTLGKFDSKTSSWLATPAAIRSLGGAIFGDRRYDTVFVYHNGAESYYAARGFRGLLRV